MKTSEQINELATALSKAQGEIKDAELDGFNPHYKSKFATLSSNLAVIRPVFSKYGLSVVQTPSSDDKGYTLTTIVIHSSGQFISDSVPLILSRDDMQGFGSALSYARRYSIAAFAGISQDEDDDGNAASEKPMTQKPLTNHAKFPTSPSDIKRLFATMDEAGISPDSFKDILFNFYGVSSSKELTKQQVDEICQNLKALPSDELMQKSIAARARRETK